jgi:hypothetical protein
MSFNPPDRSFRAPDGGRRWGWYVALGLLLLGCCFWSGLAAWLFAPLTPFLANRLTSVQGKAELLVPAQAAATTGHLSPDGRRMLLGWTRDGREEWVMWDLTTNERRAFNLQSGRFCWLNADQFLVNGGQAYLETNMDYLLQARDVSIMQAIRFPKADYQPARLRAAWQAAELVYVLDSFHGSGYSVLTLEQGRPVVYRDFDTDRDSITIVDALTKDIPHIRIPRRCDARSEGEPVYSPDGGYYALWPDSSSQPVRIFTREGKLVAQAAKTGWYPYLLGWTHDSSGIYVQMKISGSAAAVAVPYQPIFKLSPLTEEEARRESIKRVGRWALGVAVVIGIGWWLWRRWRQPKRTAS